MHSAAAQSARASLVTPVMSPLSDVQFSRFSEAEVAKLLTFGSRGLLEVMVPLSDDERRDIETHIKEHFGLSCALQVKASHVLYHVGRAPRLQKSFVVKSERLIEDPFFWYFFGFMDLDTMAYRAPVFLVPSHEVHAGAVHQLRGGLVHFNFIASMDKASRDRWRPYACEPAELAGRVVEFLRGQARQGITTTISPHQVGEGGTIWVARSAA